MNRLRRIITLLTLATVVSSVSACLFDTRQDQVQPPSDGGTTIPLNDPLQVFVALSEALKLKQDANYERAISTSFVFSPTLQDSLDQNFIGTGVFDNWNKTKEMDVLGLLLADAKTLRSEFSPSVLINKNTFVRYRVDYELMVVGQATPPDTTLYKGQAFFDVRNESGNWRLTFWDENDTVEGFSTWGYLRGILGLRLNP